jgi:hypothetical protein
MSATDPIHVQGLREFQTSLKRLDSDMPKVLRLGLNSVADVVVDVARPRVASQSGRARGSVRAKSTRTAVRVAGGGKRVPYYGWLDYGGKVGRSRSVVRPFKKEGRYLYPAYYATRDDIPRLLEDALVDTARQAGLEVTR